MVMVVLEVGDGEGVLSWSFFWPVGVVESMYFGTIA